MYFFAILWKNITHKNGKELHAYLFPIYSGFTVEARVMLRFVGDMARAGSAKSWAKRIEKVGVVALKTLEGARGMDPLC